jgi:hypothetical protein
MVSIVTKCRGDDLGGASWARQYAGWRPRSPREFRTRRPAPSEGPAAPTAGWRLRGESWSRAMKTKPLNGCLAKSRTIPTRATEAQDRSDERHDHDRPMRRRRLFPTADPREKRGDMPSRCRSREEALYKVPLPERGRGEITPRTPPPRSRQPAEALPNPVTRPPSI